MAVNNNSIGIYLHIPFCIKKCNYCDFCSFPDSSGELMGAYAYELARRIRDFARRNGKRRADTVYFGGGTPTLMPIECFEKIFSALNDSFLISDCAEITVECNPASIDRKGLCDLRALGVNRLSIGLQSADDKELSMLGRAHSFEGFCNTFKDARSAGFDNISVDIMYGLPSQTREGFQKTLDAIIELSPEHISAYGLKIEEGTAFFFNRESLDLPDDDAQAELYTLCCDKLKANGYQRYEISNFSKPKRESRHNLKYWQLCDYVGFGVAAYSCFEGERYGNSRDIKAFIRGFDICEERAEISNDERMAEYVMLGLRLECGIDTDEFKRAWRLDFYKAYPSVGEYIKQGFMKRTENRVSFTTKGFLVSNVILSEMLSF